MKLKINLKNFLTPLNLLVGAILFFALFLRVYRVNEILGFYYDQGRDGLVIWDLWHKAKFFLIGPTTGIAGIFRGPFYYYLLAPFYFLGGGDPVFPAVFLTALSTAAIWILHYLAKKYVDKPTAILVTILSSFSFYLVMAGRWLSNPTPMLILSALLVWGMAEIARGRVRAGRSPERSRRGAGWWVVIAFIVGLSVFHFGSAAEIFLIPAVLIFAIWQRQNLPNFKFFLLSVAAFLSTVAPLALFDLRHEGILRKNLSGFTVEEKNFGVPSKGNIKDRVEFYDDILTNNLFHGAQRSEKTILVIIVFSFLVFFPKLIKKDLVKIPCLLLFSGTLGLMFFRGNNGVIYDYYLTGYYLIFIFLFAIVLGHIWKFRLGKVFVLYFLYLFLTNNLSVTWYKISDKGDNENSIIYLNQKKAIDWIYGDARGQDFNVDIYVPPVIPYAYDYLFLWYPTTLKLRGASGRLVKDQVPLLYTLYEVDSPHPERLEAWLNRQKGIGKDENEAKFGGITVQRRSRFRN